MFMADNAEKLAAEAQAKLSQLEDEGHVGECLTRVLGEGEGLDLAGYNIVAPGRTNTCSVS